MPINPTSKPIRLNIGGTEAILHFDLNTFCAFEESTGIFFLEFITSLQSVVMEAAAKIGAASVADMGNASTLVQEQAAMEMLRKISLKHIRALIWAAWHHYNKDDEPVWPYSEKKVGSMLDAAAVTAILPQLLQASIANLQDKEAQDVRNPIQRGGQDAPQSPSQGSNGGVASGVSDEQVLASLTPRSDASRSSASRRSAKAGSKRN